MKLRNVLLVALTLVASARGADVPYEQRQDVVYGQTDGVALVMDIFTPKGTKNGLAIVDIASGAWHSDRGKIEDHKKAQMFDIFCQRGFTVFAVRPGSQTKFTAAEMRDHIDEAIRWIKFRHEEFGIDPNRMAMSGASAGGHLACLTAATASDGKPDSDNEAGESTRVAAVVAFFPPTDFGRWGGKEQTIDPSSRIGKMLMTLLFNDGATHTPEEIAAQIEMISPARKVTSAMPPTLLIHGDADFVVPLVQSKMMLEALKKAGVESELIIKTGGGHPWPIIHEEVAVAADWLEKQLKAKE